MKNVDFFNDLLLENLLDNIHVGNAAEDGLADDASDQVRVDVGSRTSVLEVALALLSDRAGDTDRATSVSNTIRKVGGRGSLVATSQTEIIVLTVNGDVLLMTLGKLLNSLLDGLVTALLTHNLSRDVSVAASTVPVALKRLGVEGNGNTEVLSDTVKEVTGDSQLITHGDTSAGTNLVLPLRGHNLSVDTRDLNASEKTSLVVSLDNVTAVDFAVTDTAVVRTLGSRETTNRPAVGVAKVIKKSVLLLDTEPNVSILVSLHELSALMSVVGTVGGTIGVVALSENNDVITKSKGIRVDGDGSQVDIGVVTRGLGSRRTIEVPLRKVFGAGGLFI